MNPECLLVRATEGADLFKALAEISAAIGVGASPDNELPCTTSYVPAVPPARSTSPKCMASPSMPSSNPSPRQIPVGTISSSSPIALTPSPSPSVPSPSLLPLRGSSPVSPSSSQDHLLAKRPSPEINDDELPKRKRVFFFFTLFIKCSEEKG